MKNLPALEEQSKEIMAKQKEFFDDAFTNPMTKTPYNVPPVLRKISERICLAYGIRGSADPMYIANVIAFELGLGDGKSNFEK